MPKPTPNSTQSPSLIETLAAAEQILRSCRESLPYTPPEAADARYWHAVAAVMNVLDPEGRCITQ